MAEAATGYAQFYPNANYGGTPVTINSGGTNNSMSGISSIKVSDSSVKATMYNRYNCDSGGFEFTLYRGDYPSLTGYLQSPIWLTLVIAGASVPALFLGPECGFVMLAVATGVGTANWNDNILSARVDPTNWTNDSISSFTVSNAYNNEKVTLYGNAQYGDRSEVFIASDRMLDGNRIGNDCASSLIIQGYCNVIVYDGVNFTGAYKTFTGPVNIPYLSAYGWNDRISSLVVQECDSRGVCFHGGASQGEIKHLFFESHATLPAQNYDGVMLPDNTVSSVQVVGGACVYTYTNANYTGTSSDWCSSG